MNLIESKLDDKLINILSNRLKLMPNNYLKDCIGENIILSKDSNDNILSIAFIDNISADKFEHYNNYIPDCDYHYIKDSVIPNVIKGGIWLGVLESLVKGKYYGTEIVNYLKGKYNSIILFADGGADYYWIDQGFVSIGTGMFLWSNTFKLTA